MTWVAGVGDGGGVEERFLRAAMLDKGKENRCEDRGGEESHCEEHDSPPPLPSLAPPLPAIYLIPLCCCTVGLSMAMYLFGT